MTTETEDWELARRIKENEDSEALQELCHRHSGIYINMIYRYGAPMSRTQINDLIDEKAYNIYMAAKKYDKEKSKFSTFLASQTMYRCLTFNTANEKDNTVNFEDACYYKADPKTPCPDKHFQEKEAFNNVLDAIENLPNEKEKTILRERYFGTNTQKLKPWHKIAKVVGMSVQGCINIHNRVIEEINKSITSTA